MALMLLLKEKIQRARSGAERLMCVGYWLVRLEAAGAFHHLPLRARGRNLVNNLGTELASNSRGLGVDTLSLS